MKKLIILLVSLFLFVSCVRLEQCNIQITKDDGQIMYFSPAKFEIREGGDDGVSYYVYDITDNENNVFSFRSYNVELKIRHNVLTND